MTSSAAFFPSPEWCTSDSLSGDSRDSRSMLYQGFDQDVPPLQNLATVTTLQASRLPVGNPCVNTVVQSAGILSPWNSSAALSRHPNVPLTGFQIVLVCTLLRLGRTVGLLSHAVSCQGVIGQLQRGAGAGVPAQGYLLRERSRVSRSEPARDGCENSCGPCGVLASCLRRPQMHGVSASGVRCRIVPVGKGNKNSYPW